MSAVDDLTELVERAGAAERAALASKWKERSDVEALQRKVRHAIEEQRGLERQASSGIALTGRWARLRENLLVDDVGVSAGMGHDAPDASGVDVAPGPADRNGSQAPGMVGSAAPARLGHAARAESHAVADRTASRTWSAPVTPR